MPKQLENNGLTEKDIKFNKNTFLEIIRSYTREAGVRNLEREISKICRKVVKKLLHIQIHAQEIQKVRENLNSINNFS